VREVQEQREDLAAARQRAVWRCHVATSK
jgi:hypothetical protein